jgi:hypothetical protein
MGKSAESLMSKAFAGDCGAEARRGKKLPFKVGKACRDADWRTVGGVTPVTSFYKFWLGRGSKETLPYLFTYVLTTPRTPPVGVKPHCIRPSRLRGGISTPPKSRIRR